MPDRNARPLALLAIALAFNSGAGVAPAQEPAEKSKQDPPAERRPMTPPLSSPEVHSDGRVTFRVRAAGAREVKLSGEWGGGARTMARDENGVWTLTTDPIKPGIYGYSFELDGFQTLDPANPGVKPMRSPRTSVLEIP